jgi:hypothetical protein
VSGDVVVVVVLCDCCATGGFCVVVVVVLWVCAVADNDRVSAKNAPVTTAHIFLETIGFSFAVSACTFEFVTPPKVQNV